MRCMPKLLVAEDLLATGESVVLDASWIDSARRGVWCDGIYAKSNVIELLVASIRTRRRNAFACRLASGGDPSEATPEVRQAMSGAMDRGRRERSDGYHWGDSRGVDQGRSVACGRKVDVSRSQARSNSPRDA